MVGVAKLGMEDEIMKKIDTNLRWLPLVGYVSFFLLYIVLGILLISGILLPNPATVTDPPLYQSLTYFDLIILLGMNLPTFFVVAIAVKKSRNIRKESGSG